MSQHIQTKQKYEVTIMSTKQQQFWCEEEAVLLLNLMKNEKKKCSHFDITTGQSILYRIMSKAYVKINLSCCDLLI